MSDTPNYDEHLRKGMHRSIAENDTDLRNLAIDLDRQLSASQSRVRELEGENERLIHNLELFQQGTRGYLERIESLQADNERLRKDAERYRWMRQYFTHEELDKLPKITTCHEFDEAIDAALAEQGGGE